MTVEEIKGAICKFFNHRAEFTGVPFIKSPNNSPAPVGCYVAVGCEAVQQDGRVMEPGPGAGFRIWEQVATIYLVEVEGDGEAIRRARNFFSRPDFIEAAAKAGFTVWEPGSIASVDTFDGEFLVRQWRMTVTVNFEDVEETETPTIRTVEGTLNAENDFKAESPEPETIPFDSGL